MKAKTIPPRRTSLAGVPLVLMVLSLALAEARAQTDAADLDGDGIPNVVDPDIDNDGIPNALDRNIDGGIAVSGPFAGQYIGDHLDNNDPSEKDMDDDGRNDDSLGENDIDGDGFTDADMLERDTDGDGRDNADAAEHDTDGDGRRDEDDNEDDDDGDGIDDREDDDDDNDGFLDDDDDDHHPEHEEIEVEHFLIATAAAPAGSESEVVVREYLSGKKRLRVDLENVPPGDYQMFVEGILRAVLTVEEDDLEAQFESNHNDDDERELDFEAFGKAISIVTNGVEWYYGIIPFPPGPDSGSGSEESSFESTLSVTEIELTRGAGLPPEARATVKGEFGLFGATGFEFEVENIAAGSYDLAIGGIVRATLVVDGEPGDTSGKLVFAIDASEPGELPLDFAAAGEPVMISQGGVAVFSGNVPSAPGN